MDLTIEIKDENDDVLRTVNVYKDGSDSEGADVIVRMIYEQYGLHAIEPTIEAEYFFFPTETGLMHLEGTQIHNLRPLDESEYDSEDVATMYSGYVNGDLVHVFSDEIKDRNGSAVNLNNTNNT